MLVVVGLVLCAIGVIVLLNEPSTPAPVQASQSWFQGWGVYEWLFRGVVPLLLIGSIYVLIVHKSSDLLKFTAGFIVVLIVVIGIGKGVSAAWAWAGSLFSGSSQSSPNTPSPGFANYSPKNANKPAAKNSPKNEVVAPIPMTNVTGIDGDPATSPDWILKFEGDIPVNQPSTVVGRAYGRVWIVITGMATLNPADGVNGPDGLNKIAGASYPLSGHRVFSAIGWYGSSTPEFVGQKNQLYSGTERELKLGPNEEPGQSGQGFRDNSGSWHYKVYVRK